MQDFSPTVKDLPVTQEFRMAGLGHFGFRLCLGILISPFLIAGIWASISQREFFATVLALAFAVPVCSLMFQWLFLSGGVRLAVNADGFVLHGLMREKSVPWQDIKRLSVSATGDDNSETCMIVRHSRRWPVSFTISDLEDQQAAERVLYNWEIFKRIAKGRE